eukprot:CAMPEP_0197435414 /NCGR_PEP_ID=MMETSP1175-20131217/3013_1 /TAXON_ID=1003142 /ORGANISM="Triceratium dubium, Strain CCMP147" /LENGTH=327 /DNA_ID=CAMNT_0042964453 /DNA_START=72 /DNA_END=1055 /DNA_ORIENTATION=+
MTQQCESHGVSDCIADPVHLFRVKCTMCNYAHDYSPYGASAAKYLYHRRRTRAAQGLLSVGAPLDVPSANFLCQTSVECGIISNTNSPHVSFVEGLVPEVNHTASVRRLKDALFRDPTLTVVSVHRVPRRDNVTDLILADVVMNPGADYAAKRLADSRVCNLPQFAFHVALGACPRAGGGSKRAAAWAEARLKGVMLAMDATRVRVLPPPEGSRGQSLKRTPHPRQRHNQGQKQNHYRHHHHQQQQQQHWQCDTVESHGSLRHYHQQHHFVHSHQQWQNSSVESSAKMKAGYETDETDAASTSTASSLSEEQEAQFPGLAVDLTFLE